MHIEFFVVFNCFQFHIFLKGRKTDAHSSSTIRHITCLQTCSLRCVQPLLTCLDFFFHCTTNEARPCLCIWTVYHHHHRRVGFCISLLRSARREPFYTRSSHCLGFCAVTCETCSVQMSCTFILEKAKYNRTVLL